MHSLVGDTGPWWQDIHSRFIFRVRPFYPLEKGPQSNFVWDIIRSMADSELCSIPWFCYYMQLPNEGVTPTVTPTSEMPSRPALAHFWRPKRGPGYTFDNHDSPRYEVYVRELFTRVLQVKWPLSGVLPFHFARGLLAEAMGMSVNWAEFAYKSTHLHQSPCGSFRILPEFEELVAPLPPLIIVLPPSDFEVSLYSSFQCQLHRRFIRKYSESRLQMRPCLCFFYVRSSSFLCLFDSHTYVFPLYFPLRCL